MSNLETAKKLLHWNTVYLNQKADLKKSDLAEFFPEHFQVSANGRVYDANYDNYFYFLNQMRAPLQSIRYQIQEMIEAKDAITIAMKATTTNLDQTEQLFEALLLLKFNSDHKITLWHEVYIPLT